MILNNRLSELVESKLSDAQSGFRPNRSTLDSIFIVHQTFENAMNIILISILYLLTIYKLSIQSTEVK